MFTSAQQKAFRAVVARAWARCSDLLGTRESDKNAREAWYRSELEKATGHASTLMCDTGRNYEAAIAHFEVLAEDAIKWQMRLHGADKRRVLHVAREIAGEMHKRGFEAEALKAANYDTGDDYLLAIGRKTSGRYDVAGLEQFTPVELSNIVISLKRHLARLLPASERPSKRRHKLSHAPK